MQRIKICASCNQEIHGYPATSRKDNTTAICTPCALLEAVHEYAQWEIATYSSVTNSYCLKCQHNRKIGENDGLTCQDGGEV